MPKEKYERESGTNRLKIRRIEQNADCCGERSALRGTFCVYVRIALHAGGLHTSCSLQVARGTSHDARQGCRVALSHNICAFCAAKCGSERYKDVTRTDTARNSLMKSEVEKRPNRFSFIGYAHNSSALLRIALISRELKNAWRVFLL